VATSASLRLQSRIAVFFARPGFTVSEQKKYFFTLTSHFAVFPNPLYSQ
jgi:hypothetical protein